MKIRLEFLCLLFYDGILRRRKEKEKEEEKEKDRK
jgi:hypothetical protein